MRAALKVTPPVLLRWPMMSEVDADSMFTETEPSHQHPTPRCCHVTGGSRGAVRQNAARHGSAGEVTFR